MSFIAPAQHTEPASISNGPFWPDIDLSELRKTVRLDGTVTAERLKHAAINAVIQVNTDLAAWRTRQQQNSHTCLANVPAEQINGQSIYLQLYLRAVYCLTRANLTERYADFDATAKGSKDAAEQNQTITDLYRDARFAIRDILGNSHVTVELI